MQYKVRPRAPEFEPTELHGHGRPRHGGDGDGRMRQRLGAADRGGGGRADRHQQSDAGSGARHSSGRHAAFQRGEQLRHLERAAAAELAEGQSPFAAYVTCSDSRVPPELLFGRGLDELFIIRNAGNTVDTVALGSIEYAVGVLGVPLVVVMGHESYGAVKAAVDVKNNATFPGQIGRMIEPIIPAVLASRENGTIELDNAVRQNVRRVVSQLRNQTDPLMQEPLAKD